MLPFLSAPRPFVVGKGGARLLLPDGENVDFHALGEAGVDCDSVILGRLSE